MKKDQRKRIQRMVIFPDGEVKITRMPAHIQNMYTNVGAASQARLTDLAHNRKFHCTALIKRGKIALISIWRN